MANIKDVARHAGVSVATVSRVLNGQSPVAATRDRVLAAVDALGYRPNAVARSLRTDRTRTVGLVISDLRNPFFTDLAQAVEFEARTRGYSLIIGNAGEQPDQQDDYIRALLDRRIDGLLVSAAGEGTALLRDAVASGTPLVLLDRAVPGLTADAPAGAPDRAAAAGPAGAPCVRADGRRALEELADHLVALGRRRPAVIVAPAGTPTGDERLAQFRAALARHGLGLPDARAGSAELSPAGGRRVMAALLDLDPADRPDAVLAADNLMALGALEELRTRGLRVPDDMALAVYDDVPWFPHTDPPITAIAQPTDALGRAAVHALIERIEGRWSPSVLLPAELVVRRSCGEPAGAAERPPAAERARGGRGAEPPGPAERADAARADGAGPPDGTGPSDAAQPPPRGADAGGGDDERGER